MVRKLENVDEMGFVEIAEAYPNDYILVKIVEMDYLKGRFRGIPWFTSDLRKELLIKGEEKETTVLEGINLMPIIGGLL